MKNVILVAALALSTAAFAQAQPQDNNQDARAQRREQMIQLRASRIAERLGLDQAGAQRLQQTFESFAQRRQDLHQQMKAQIQILRAAANGDATAAGQVDGAIDQLEQLRQQQFQLQQDTFNAISQGLSPAQKAKLVFALRPMGGRGHFGKHAWRGWQQNQGGAQQQ